MNPVAFEVFGFKVMWYGILIALGVILGTAVGIREAKKRGYDEDTIINLMLVAVPAALVGARIYYVIFSWDIYRDDPISALNFREGGLAIHGGLIGAVLASLIYCKVKNLRFWKIADIMAPSIILGQAIGRWGNYANQEAHGGPTDLPWAITIDGVKVHPTFFYEFLWNIIVFAFLMKYRSKKIKFEGQIFLMYLMLYSVGRFFIEGLRTDSLMIGPLRTAQLISVLIILVSAAVYYVKSRNSKENVQK